MLLNLMSNANKFTEKGTISIAAHQGQETGRDWIRVAVADTGIGSRFSKINLLFSVLRLALFPGLPSARPNPVP